MMFEIPASLCGIVSRILNVGRLVSRVSSFETPPASARKLPPWVQKKNAMAKIRDRFIKIASITLKKLIN